MDSSSGTSGHDLRVDISTDTQGSNRLKRMSTVEGHHAPLMPTRTTVLLVLLLGLPSAGLVLCLSAAGPGRHVHNALRGHDSLQNAFLGAGVLSGRAHLHCVFRLYGQIWSL